MSIQDVLESLWAQVTQVCIFNGHKPPPFNWTCRHALHILQMYPTGLTRAVLLTELEVKWRMAVRRGEHTHKLGQVLMLMQLELSDIVTGILQPIDDFRCRITPEDDTNGGIDAILHRQLSDFRAFTRHYQFPLFSPRPVCFTHGRLLKGKPIMLLPTPYFSFGLSLANAQDMGFLRETLLPLHHKSLRILQAAQSELAINKCNEDITLLFAHVTRVGNVFTHPISASTKVRIVQLQATVLEEEVCYAAAATVEGVRTVYMILLDEQVSLAKLWTVGDLLLVYRPYVALNSDETLFGSRTAGTSNYGIHTIAHDVIQRSAVDLEGVRDDPWTMPVHFFYGGSTVCCHVYSQATATATATATASATSTNGAAAARGGGGGGIAGSDNAKKVGQPLDFISMCSVQVNGPFALLARVLSLRANASAPGATNCTNTGDHDGSVDIWLQPLVPYMHTSSATTMHTSSLQHPPSLLVIRVAGRTMHSLLSDKSSHIHVGQLLFLDELYHDTSRTCVSKEDSQVVCADEKTWLERPVGLGAGLGAGTGGDGFQNAHLLALTLRQGYRGELPCACMLCVCQRFKKISRNDLQLFIHTCAFCH